MSLDIQIIEISLVPINTIAKCSVSKTYYYSTSDIKGAGRSAIRSKKY